MEGHRYNVTFEKFGHVWIRVDRIAAIDLRPFADGSSQAQIWLMTNDGVVLAGKAADAFKVWWETHKTATEEEAICDFVQIGRTAIRLDNIADIHFGPDSTGQSRVWIHMVGDVDDQEMVLTNEQADAFTSWWDAHANVRVIGEEEKEDE